MKGICIGMTGNDYTFRFEGEAPEAGHKYQLESLVDGTQAQNKLFHSLLMVYYNSGLHSENGVDFHTFKDLIKKRLGGGFEAFIYAEIIDGHPVIKHAKKKEDIPEEIRQDPHMKEMILGKLKSWSSYSKKQRKSTIDNLISEMIQVGVNSRKFQEIMKGIGFEHG